jgi:predicted phosphodiesterase
MALYGVIGDIHGNREALLAVLEALDRRGIASLLCVGDIVGYNADSNACAALLRARGALAIAGNHDLISIGRLDSGRCANKVAYSLKRTRRGLSQESRAYLASLPTHLVIENRILMVHAGVRDVEQYVATRRLILQNAALLRCDFPRLRICLFGHVHTQKAYEVDEEEVRDLRAGGPLTLRPDRIHFINPGSVDAARKQDRSYAEFAILDSDALRVEFQRVAYDTDASETKAIAGGYRIGPWVDRFYTLRRRFIAAF